MGRRTVLLLAAILVAAIGTGLVFLYVQGADQRARSGQQSVTAFQAIADIPAGQSFNAAGGKIKQIQVPASSRDPLTWLSRPTDVDGKVTKTVIPAGSIILVTQFAATAQESSSASPIDIANGNVAVSVQMSDTGRVAGFLRQGSSVTVYLTRDNATAVLFGSAKVITVGSIATKQEPANAVGPETLPKSLVTLEVPAKDADRLILASTAGELSFALRGPDATVSDTDRTTTADLP